MTIQDKISQHYQNSISGELKKYHCEEWGTDIYFRTTHSFKDEAKIIELASKGQVVEALVETVLVKSRDANDKRLFTDADRFKLMNEADPAVIIKISTAINEAKIQLSTDQIAKE
jgi:hypothetical protein